MPRRDFVMHSAESPESEGNIAIDNIAVAWEQDRERVYQDYKDTAPRFTTGTGEEVRGGDAFEFGYRPGYVRGYAAAQAEAERALAASVGRVADLEQVLRLVRADVKNALNGYGDDCLLRALGAI